MAKREINLMSRKIRAKILNILLETPKPLHFSAIHQKVEPMSTRTLSKHLINLEKEGLISRKIEGRKIVFELNKPKTVIEMRKEFFEQFISLLRVYGIALNSETHAITQKYVNTIRESIEKPEPEAETTKAFTRTIDYKKSVKIPISKPYKPIEFKKAETTKCEPKEPNLTVEPLNLKRQRKKKQKNVLGK